MKNIFKITQKVFWSLMFCSIFFQKITAQEIPQKSFWPNGAKLVISISMQFETGGQLPTSENPFSSQILSKGTPDLIADSWFRYGANEGLTRMMDLWKKYDIKVTSHVVGQAAQKYPDLLKRLVKEGHEASGHGMEWKKGQAEMDEQTEKSFITANVQAIKNITGQSPVGYNAFWLERGVNTLKVLQSLGFIYHVDDLSRDEPSVTKVNGKPFVIIPYSIRNNDIVSLEGKNWSPDQFLNQLKLEFNQLYQESKTKRRMMSISLHDRIGGTPAVINVIEQFINYVKTFDGVEFMRKVDIANLIINDPATIIDDSEKKYNN